MSFERAVTFVLQWEGGEVTDPLDPGGHTKYGISQRQYPQEDIGALTVDRATELYCEDYWKPCQCDALPWPVALGVFDMAVNAGQRASVRCLQRSVGTPDDGELGPMTLKAVAGRNANIVAQDLAVERLRHYAALPGWGRFGAAWAKRTIAAVIEGMKG